MNYYDELKKDLEELFNGTVSIGPSVDVTWAGGSFSFIQVGNTAFFSKFESKSNGALTEVVGKIPSVLRKYGFVATSLFNDDPDAVWITKIGFKPVPNRPGLYRRDLSTKSGEQYAAWKAGTASEPDWHK